jgi:hypothetical protein
MFKKTRDFWLLKCLTLARIGFSEQRSGHGKALLERLVTLAPIFGYQYIAIERANMNSAAFSKRMGLTSYQDRYHWIGFISDIKYALQGQHCSEVIQEQLLFSNSTNCNAPVQCPPDWG